MMELWNIYDQYRHKTERIHERGQEMKDGDYHLVVHVWIVNDNGEFLIQKRQPWKKGWAGMWDCAAAGSAILGDSSEQAAVREVKEELGIDLDIKKSERLFTVKFSCGFDDVWLVRQNVEPDELSLQEEEVAEAKWASEGEIKEMVERGEFIPFNYLDLLFDLARSNISLEKATAEDAEELLRLQKEVFLPLYKKYNDHETSPVTQTMERFLKKFERGDYFKIWYEGNLAGSVYVYEKSPGLMKLHIINILEKYHNRGIAQKVMTRLELMYPEADAWELSTILTEKKNCYVYEKMGYRQFGEQKVINDQLTIVGYRKESNLNRIKSIQKAAES
jgi:isopentenyldiphosphate isomerase